LADNAMEYKVTRSCLYGLSYIENASKRKNIDHLTQQFSLRNSDPIRRKGARFFKIFTKSVNIKSAVMILFVQDAFENSLDFIVIFGP
jgi:hypothetical protein